MALTPIAPFRPRRWRGAVLKSGTGGALPGATAQAPGERHRRFRNEVRDVTEVLVRESRDRSVTLLFDPSTTWKKAS